MKVKLLHLDVPNGNNQIYPREVGEAMVQQAAVKAPLGGLGLPEMTKLDLAKVSHTVEDVHIEGEYLVGTIRVLETPQGRILRELLDNGDDCQFRTRATVGFNGHGDINTNGEVSNITITSFDFIN